MSAASDGDQLDKMRLALEDCQRALRETQRVAGVGSFAFDIAAGTWSGSEVLERMYGIGAGASHGRTLDGWLDLVHADDREPLRAHLIDEVLGRGLPFDREYRIVARDTQAITWVHGLGRLDLDAAGRPLRLVGTVQDITARRTADAALAQRDALFHLVFDQSPIGKAMVGLDRRFLHCNQAFSHFVGRTQEELTGVDVLDLTWPEDRAIGLTEMRELLDGRVTRAQVHKRYLRQDGQVVWADVTLALIRGAQGQPLHFLAALQDATGRKQAADALADSERTYREIFDATSDALFIHDELGAIVDVNARMCAMFGCSRETAISLRVDDISQGTAPYSQAEALEHMRLALAEGSRTFPWRCRRRDGTLFWTEVALRSCHIMGRTRIIAAVRDITERLRAEAALRQSEEKYAVAFSASPDSINLNRLDDGVYLDINEGFTAITGYRREEVLGRSSLPGDLSIWVQAEDRARMVATLRSQGQVVGLEAPFRRRDGSILIGLMSARIVTIDGQLVVLSITRDITDRTRAEETLRAREEDLAITLHSIGDGVIATDAGGRITRLNRVAEELTGWSGAEALGHPLSAVFHIIHAGTRAVAENPVDKVLRLGEVIALANHTLLIARDGRERQIADSAAPIRDPRGLVRGVVLVFRDVTEKHLLEAQFHQAQKQQAIGHLAGGIAHDFNNMLGVILGAAEMIQHRTGSDPAVARPLAMLTDAAQRAADLTTKLLGFARRGKVREVPVDLHQEIATVAAILTRTIDRRITIVTELATPEATLTGDPSLLQNLLLNLCINARDAMPEGGTLTLATEAVPAHDPRLRTQGLPAVPHLALTVSDTGCGIPDWVLARLFEPFVTTKDPGKGTGLGLASVYGTVREHQGAITVASRAGQGTTFRLLLPACRPGTPFQERRTAAAQVDLRGQTVLIADDEDLVRQLLAILLEEMGATVIQALDGHQALELFQAAPDRFSLVILDAVMPGLNGRDTFRAIHALRPRTRVLISSGFVGDPSIGALEQDGLAGFLAKPYTQADLTRLLAAGDHPAGPGPR